MSSHIQKIIAAEPPIVRPRLLMPRLERAWQSLTQALDYFLPGQNHLRLLALLVLASFALRMFLLNKPDGALIFDEKYYVNSARMIAGLPSGYERYPAKPFGIDPNTEHPPLAKVLVAGSMLLWGDNALGWRFPSVLAGTATVLLMYGVARRVGASPYVALLAATLLAFDNLVFVHSRIFTLDIFQLAFMLLGVYCYLGNRPTLAGVAIALAALSKIGGVFVLPAIVAFEALRLLRGDHSWQDGVRTAARRLTVMSLTFVAVFLVLLGTMDRIWVGYRQPLEHVQRIVSYGTALRREIPAGIESYPWQWLWNHNQISYVKVDHQVKVGGEVRETRPIVHFLGAMNPYVLHLLPLGLGITAWAWWRRRPGAELGAFALAWFAAMYLPFVAAYVFGHRISYIFYFLPSMPAVALAGAYFLLHGGLPRPIVWVYLGAVLLAFYGYFPFKPIPS